MLFPFWCKLAYLGMSLRKVKNPREANLGEFWQMNSSYTLFQPSQTTFVVNQQGFGMRVLVHDFLDRPDTPDILRIPHINQLPYRRILDGLFIPPLPELHLSSRIISPNLVLVHNLQQIFDDVLNRPRKATRVLPDIFPCNLYLQIGQSLE